eukprot:2442698-Pleurochrysis_carterae.AAC.1
MRACTRAPAEPPNLAGDNSQLIISRTVIVYFFPITRLLKITSIDGRRFKLRKGSVVKDIKPRLKHLTGAKYLVGSLTGGEYLRLLNGSNLIGV